MTGTTSPNSRHSPILPPSIDIAREEVDARIERLDALFNVLDRLGNPQFCALDAQTQSTYLWMCSDLVHEVKEAWQRLETMLGTDD